MLFCNEAERFAQKLQRAQAAAEWVLHGCTSPLTQILCDTNPDLGLFAHHHHQSDDLSL